MHAYLFTILRNIRIQIQSMNMVIFVRKCVGQKATVLVVGLATGTEHVKVLTHIVYFIFW